VSSLSFVEQAKLTWKQQNYHQALLELQEGMKRYFPDLLNGNTTKDSKPSQEDRNAAKVLLLYARWIQYAGQVHSDPELAAKYEQIIKLQPKYILMAPSECMINFILDGRKDISFWVGS
jgi:hypothetical protein